LTNEIYILKNILKNKKNEEIMPCMCWFEPPEESKKMIKYHCQQIVDEIKRLDREGDPIGLEIKDVKELLDHLYDPTKCEEKNA
jgi:hypothetical protein